MPFSKLRAGGMLLCGLGTSLDGRRLVSWDGVCFLVRILLLLLLLLPGCGGLWLEAGEEGNAPERTAAGTRKGRCTKTAKRQLGVSVSVSVRVSVSVSARARVRVSVRVGLAAGSLAAVGHGTISVSYT